MAIDRCPTHGVKFDRDYLEECPACTEDAEEETEAETVSEPSIVRLQMPEAELETYREAAIFAIACMKLYRERLTPYAPESYHEEIEDAIETLSTFRKKTHYPEYVA